MNACNPNTIRCLGRHFNPTGNCGSRRIDAQQMKDLMPGFGCKVTPDEGKCFMAGLDTDGNGSIDYDKLLCCLRGSLNAAR